MDWYWSVAWGLGTPVLEYFIICPIFRLLEKCCSLYIFEQHETCPDSIFTWTLSEHVDPSLAPYTTCDGKSTSRSRVWAILWCSSLIPSSGEFSHFSFSVLQRGHFSILSWLLYFCWGKTCKTKNFKMYSLRYFLVSSLFWSLYS